MYKILICDDEKDIVNALKIYLNDPNYQLFEAYNGKEALEIMKKEEIRKSGLPIFSWDCFISFNISYGIF